MYYKHNNGYYNHCNTMSLWSMVRVKQVTWHIIYHWIHLMIILLRLMNPSPSFHHHFASLYRFWSNKEDHWRLGKHDHDVNTKQLFLLIPCELRSKREVKKEKSHLHPATSCNLQSPFSHLHHPAKELFSFLEERWKICYSQITCYHVEPLKINRIKHFIYIFLF